MFFSIFAIALHIIKTFQQFYLQTLLFFQMKYPTSSALENHYLQSIIPYSFLQEEKQFTKNKDFYQPEKFIWNNPHRTSSKIYPYYHKYNDDYMQTTQLKIKQLEQHERHKNNETRIKHLLDLKAQTRQALFNRKKKRKTLEDRCFSNNNVQRAITQQSGPNFANEKYTKSNYQSAKKNLKTQKSYQNSIRKYDQRQHQIEQLFNYKRQQTHNIIREKFQKRKLNNFETMSKIQKFGKTFKKHSTINCQKHN